MNRLINTLDHPVVFLVVLTIGVFATKTLLEAGFKVLGWSGPSAIFE